MVNKQDIILLSVVVILLVFPFVFYHGLGEDQGYFSGSDDQGSAAIESTGYHPWISSIWEPPSPEIESLLFAVQAAIGALIVGYVLGYYHGQAKARKKDETDEEIKTTGK